MKREKNIAEKIHLQKQMNVDGPMLVYAKESGVNIIEKDGCFFKDLSKDGEVYPYEDWRLSSEDRAKDLTKRLSVEQMAGLMLFSDYNVLPTNLIPIGDDTYFGEKYDESKYQSWEVTDHQYDFVTKENGRHILLARIKDSETITKWNNSIQMIAESQPFGIPVNTGTDPRHTLDMSAEYNMANGGGISVWPESPGLASTFEPEIARRYGEVIAKDMRAMGLYTLLGPQMDLGTEPRWMRYRGTFGQSPELSTDFAKAYCEGLQTSYGEDEIKDGWGRQSVNAIVKHWPGGGTGEGGRDAHFSFGKYAVYPGNNFEEHLKPFTEGAFKLEGGTQKAGGVMPYYTISFNQDTKNGENTGNAFSQYIVNDLLRTKYGYDGVVCTDWKVTQNLVPDNEMDLPGRCWGMENATEAQRHLKAILSGVDQFGGNQKTEPLLEAYKQGCLAVGEQTMKNRYENSARRILTVMFRLGLFENPYVDVENADKVLRSENHLKQGYEAQIKSVVMVKNKNHILPLKKKKVYIPSRFYPKTTDWFGNVKEEHWEFPVDKEVVAKYFELVDEPENADAALVFMEGPNSGFGFEQSDIKQGGNGYVPVSLQYDSYTATEARAESIAADEEEKSKNGRCYKGKTITAGNKNDLDMLLETKQKMGDKPVIAAVNMMRPCIVNEFEDKVDGLFLHFGVEDAVMFDLISGVYEPSGLLPVQIPSDMATVEHHYEDVPFDMECHKDTEDHVYDFAFGMNWKGVIDDYRVRKYGCKNRIKM